MKLDRRRAVLFVVFLVFLAVAAGALLLLRIRRYESDASRTPAATPVVHASNPPQGINGVREETFSIANGFARSFDEDDLVGWKNARNVQVRGVVAGWSGGTLTVKLGGGTLALKVSDPVRYYCFPAVAPGADGGDAVKTSTLYTPIRDPQTVGRAVPLAEAARRLAPGAEVHVVAVREGEWLTAVLVAGYGCGYPEGVK